MPDTGAQAGAAKAVRPPLEPMPVNEVAVVTAGMVLWALALIVMVVFFRDDLRRHHATWWIWSCLLGLALGLYGLRFAWRRRRQGLA